MALEGKMKRRNSKIKITTTNNNNNDNKTKKGGAFHSSGQIGKRKCYLFVCLFFSHSAFRNVYLKADTLRTEI